MTSISSPRPGASSATPQRTVACSCAHCHNIPAPGQTLCRVCRTACAAANPPLSQVCVSSHHKTPVVTDNGTDRCDTCWYEAQTEMDAQR